jgi:DNA topoisomerase-2
MDISQFLECELIKYSYENCKSKLPNIIDGLKECQRKILYAVKKRNLHYNSTSLKVAQLGGYVAEHTNYHHGEDNLYNTIIKLASNYVDSNNIPLLYQDGMFGTRLENGKDAANARYIYTKMDYLTEFIYLKEDDSILDYVTNDGDVVEPSFYVPIIPMILVNKTFGIATGFSSTIPLYNPIDIVNVIKVWLHNKGVDQSSSEVPCSSETVELPELHPWYRNFKGTIVKDSETKYTTQGIVMRNEKIYNISEISVGTSINDYKEYLESLMEKKKIKSFSNYSTPSIVNFEVVANNKDDDLMSELNLTSCITTTNMTCIDHTMKISQYSIPDIIDTFCNVRYKFYTLRKQALIDKIIKDIRVMESKVRFINDVNADVISLKTKKSTLLKSIEDLHYNKEEESYGYLLQMTAVNFTSDKVQKLTNNIVNMREENLVEAQQLDESEMWLKDLNKFVTEYNKWIVSDPEKNQCKGNGRGRGSKRGQGRGKK